MAERAERLARAGDRDIVLSLDGYLRWQGEPVARLVAGDDVLKPRFVLLADEQLIGPGARPGRGAASRPGSPPISPRLLKPLVDLAPDPALAGMARGIAFRLVENLGILERRDVAEEVRGLDQEARARAAPPRRPLRRPSPLRSGAAEARRRARCSRSSGR